MATPTGRIYLLENVFINSSYEHTVDFQSAEEQFAYWRSFSKKEYERCQYVRKDRQYIVVEATLDELQTCNYMIFKSTEDSKTYYAFITSKEYCSNKATYVYFELDVMQTYLFDFKFMPSYVLREHCDRWDADHKPIYSRTAEDLDYGQEYTTEAAYKIVKNPERTLSDVGATDGHKVDFTYFLAICVDHPELIEEGAASEPTRFAENNVTPYCMYLLPFDRLKNQNVVFNTGLADQFSATTFDEFLNYMGRSAMGNFVKQIVHLPYLPINYVEYTAEGVIAARFAPLDDGTVFKPTKLKGLNFPVCNIRQLSLDLVGKDLASMGIFEGIEDAMPTAKQWEEIKANPLTTERDKRFESKLLTYPYRYNIMTDFRGQPAIIKNEYIGSDKIKLKFTAGIGFNTPYRYWVDGYRKDPEGRQNSVNQLTPLESPILSDAYYTYMLENKNQLQANVANSAVSGIAGVAGGVAGGFMTGGPIGALIGGIGAAAAATVNTTNMVRSQNAKKADLKNMPDTVLNSNDCSMCLLDDNLYLTFYRKKICCEFEQLLADTFNMSGYNCQHVKVPNLKSRARFNYIQTVGANIKGSFDQQDLAKIKRIFDNGITFWHYSAEDFNPLDYSYENIERSLL